MPTLAGRPVHPLTAILLILLALLFLVILIPLALLFALIYLFTRLTRALFSPTRPATAMPGTAVPEEGRRNVRVLQNPPPPAQ